MANGVANETTNRLRKPATIVSFLLLLLSVAAIAASNTSFAYADGVNRGGCSSLDSNGREYNATFKSFTISNGVQSVDVLNTKGAAMNVDINKGYTITFTIHALNTGTTFYTDSSGNPHYQSATFSDSKTGSVWRSSNVWRVYTQNVCYHGFTINGDQSKTQTISYSAVNPHFALPDSQNVFWETTNSTVRYTVTWVNNTASSSSSQLNVKSQDANGNTISGYYTVLYQNGAVTKTGYTPATFTLNTGQTYTVEVQDYGSYHFAYWLDTGSNNRDRAVSASTSPKVLTAVYCNSACSPPSGQSLISVSTVNSAGAAINGYYTTLWQKGVQLRSCYSPCGFTVGNGQTYQIAVADYGSESFNHWNDGTTNRFHTVNVPSSITTLRLTAIYSP